MKKSDKQKSTFFLLVAIVLLFLFGKKKLIPSVEVGEGDFGEFGTEGELSKDEDFKTPGFNPNSRNFGNKTIFSSTYISNPFLNDGSYEKGCGVCD